MNSALFAVPAGLDDCMRPSGGNTYDLRLIEGLRELGWTVHLLRVEVAGPTHTAAAALAEQHDGSMVLIDGLVASTLSEVLVGHSQRLHLVLLVHMPRQNAAEQRVAAACTSVIATSEWTRRWLIDSYHLSEAQIQVVQPGVQAAAMAQPSACGGRLLCVAAVCKHKGQDVLMHALAGLRGRDWRCSCVGSLDVEPAFSAMVEMLRENGGLGDQVRLLGPLRGRALEAAYQDADLLVLPSLHETYGMVITEALAHGVPVLASDTGGVREALGTAGAMPGILVAPGDATALADAIEQWLGDEELRGSLRAAAVGRRQNLRPWSDTAESMARVLVRAGA